MSSGEGDVDVSRSSPSSEMSALESITVGHEDVPDSVGGFEIDMNSSINLRWSDGDHEVECSHTGEFWKMKVCEDGEKALVGRYEERSSAVEAARKVMSGEEVDGGEEEITQAEEAEEEQADEERSEFEKEVESILEDVDTDSVKEVNEAFGD